MSTSPGHLLDHGTGRNLVRGASDEEGDAGVEVVRVKLAGRQPQLAELVAVVRGVDEERTVRLAGLLDRGHHALDQIVHRHQRLPSGAEQRVDAILLLPRDDALLAHELVVVGGAPVVRREPRRAVVGEVQVPLIPRRRRAGYVRGVRRNLGEERMPGSHLLPDPADALVADEAGLVPATTTKSKSRL